MLHHFWDKETLEYTESLDVKPGRIPPNGDSSPLPAWDTETQKLVRDIKENVWVVKSLKEFTEHLISIGHKSISDLEKVNDAGEIVPLVGNEVINAIKSLRIKSIESGNLTKEQVIAEKLSEISQKAKAKIEGGFRSKAKSGQWYIYDSELEDQFNMQTLVMSGIDSPYRCRKESDGVKTFYPHTNAQLVQIVTEFTQFKVGILSKADEFRTLLNALETALEVENFVVAF